MPDFSAPVPVVEPPPPKPTPPPEPPTAFVPLVLILSILIFSNVRDILNLRHHLATTRTTNAQSAARLEKVGKEAELVAKLRENLSKLADTDPVAARIKADFFPSTMQVPQPPPKDDAPAPAGSFQDKNPGAWYSEVES